LMLLLSLTSSLFPYSTLFRSYPVSVAVRVGGDDQVQLRHHRATRQWCGDAAGAVGGADQRSGLSVFKADGGAVPDGGHHWPGLSDRKSTRLNSSHVKISYAVF